MGKTKKQRPEYIPVDADDVDRQIEQIERLERQLLGRIDNTDNLAPIESMGKPRRKRLL